MPGSDKLEAVVDIHVLSLGSSHIMAIGNHSVMAALVRVCTSQRTCKP